MLRYTCFSLVIVCHMPSLVAIASDGCDSVGCAGGLPCVLAIPCYCIRALWHLCCTLACEVMGSTRRLVITFGAILRQNICLDVYVFVFIYLRFFVVQNAFV